MNEQRNKKPVDTYEGYLEKEDRQRVSHAEHCNNMFVAALHRELESMASRGVSRNPSILTHPMA